MEDAAPARSGLFVPGSAKSMLAKAGQLEADELVLDLEDAVAPAHKTQARQQVVDALETCPGTTSVRINEVGGQWVLDAVRALVTAPVPPQSLVVPKVESVGDVVFLDRLLDGLEAMTRRVAPRLQLLVETARGLRHVDEFLRASHRTTSVILGYADLAASLRCAPYDAGREADAWLSHQATVVAAARAAGVRAIDGPHLALEDTDGLSVAARRARAFGFDAKWAVHPAQLPAIHTAFSPSAQEVREAQEVLTAAEGQVQAAFSLHGRMVDEAVLKQARVVVARAHR